MIRKIKAMRTGLKPYALSIVALVILFLALVGFEALGGPGKTATTCATGPAPTPYTGKAVKLEAPTDAKIDQDVGRERGGFDVATLKLTVPRGAELGAGGTSLTGAPDGPFTPAKGEGDGQLEGVKVGVVLEGRVVVVRSCVDTAGVSPGRYTGTISIGGGEIEPLTVPATVTVKDSAFAAWALVAALFGAIAFGLRAFSSIAELVEPPPTKQGEDGAPTRSTQRKALSFKDGWLAYTRPAGWYVFTLIASGAGVFGAWTATYVGNPTWGADLKEDAGKLIAAAFSGAVAGKTLADFLPAAQKARQDPAPPAPPDPPAPEGG
jgi:hypothetical protein